MQNKRFTVNGFPSDIIMHDKNFNSAIASENGALNISKVLTFNGDKTHELFLEPSSGNRLILKGISILGDGNSGNVSFVRGKDTTNIFKSYFSSQVKGAPSSAFNFILDIDEKVYLTTSSRGTSETFCGISYIESPY